MPETPDPETPDRVLTAPATSPRSRALGSCDVDGSLRLAPAAARRCFGDGSYSGGASGGHAMREETARFNPLDVAGEVRRIAHGDVSRRHWHIRPGAGLPAMPFSANIFDQVTPDANLASVNVLG